MDEINCIKKPTSATSQSNSTTSSNSDIDKDIAELDINNCENGNGQEDGNESGGSMTIINKNLNTNTLKKRMSSSRTPTRKAKRVRFYRNGDRFYGGIVIPVSNERYRFVFIQRCADENLVLMSDLFHLQVI